VFELKKDGPRLQNVRIDVYLFLILDRMKGEESGDSPRRFLKQGLDRRHPFREDSRLQNRWPDYGI